jgi:serine/threonine-protein kinase
MSTEPSDLDDVLAAYALAEEAGDRPECERILAAHPDLVAELRAWVENGQWLPRPWSSAPAQQAIPSRLGNFELVGTPWLGGQALVYKALDVTLNRLVALKIPRAADQARPEDKARFLKDAEALALLDHPNIVRVYQSGEDQGRLYFAMELVEGETLRTKLARGCRRRNARRPPWSAPWPERWTSPTKGALSIATSNRRTFC